jgi:iron complex transport system permease protein
MNRIKWMLLICCSLAAIVSGIFIGSAGLAPFDLLALENRQILMLRIVRVLLGFFTGAGLGICGAVLQAVLRNPLADPYILGTSSGAGLGAVIAVMLGVSSLYLPVVAFIGAALTMFLVYMLARENGMIALHSMILSGVIVSMAFSGLIVFIVSVTPDEGVHGMIWWLLGSLQTPDTRLLMAIMTAVSAGSFVLSFLSRDLDLICLGEEMALQTGVDVEALKKIVFITAALITGALVSVSGMIGFVGLIIPHMVRLITGPGHSRLIPATAIAGGGFLVICDTLARTLFSPAEMPIGVVTSLAGAPLFIYLLKRSQRVDHV